MNCPTCNKPTPPDSVHTCSPVPLLTAEDCEHWIHVDAEAPSKIDRAAAAIAEGRAVVVPRMSEAEALSRRQVQYLHPLNTVFDAGYLAALRDIGCIA